MGAIRHDLIVNEQGDQLCDKSSDQLASGIKYAFDRPMNYSHFILLGNYLPRIGNQALTDSADGGLILSIRLTSGWISYVRASGE